MKTRPSQQAFQFVDNVNDSYQPFGEETVGRGNEDIVAAKSPARRFKSFENKRRQSSGQDEKMNAELVEEIEIV